SWALTMMRRSRLFALLSRAFAALLRAGMKPSRVTPATGARTAFARWDERFGDNAWYAALLLIGLVALWKTATFVHGDVPVGEIGRVVLYGLSTLLRGAVLIALASLIWVPIGVWVGLRPQVAS